MYRRELLIGMDLMIQQMRCWVISTAVVFVTCTPNAVQAQEELKPAITVTNLRKNIQRAVAPLEQSMLQYRANRRCFSCHHHAHAIIALSEMSRRGLKIDLPLLQMQFLRTVAQTKSVDRRYEKKQNIGGGIDTVGYALLAIRTGGHPPDKTTESMVKWILDKNPDQGFWSGTKNRAPTQTSDITRTWLSLDALEHFGTKALVDSIRERKHESRKWLLETPVNSTEDKVSRIRALSIIGDAGSAIEKFSDQLISEQRADGGWAQSANLKSDAYSTGSVLMTLHQQAGYPTDRKFYRRGVEHLLNAQLNDGTWQVTTRATPVQEYFESGFPHGRDQYISFSATCWAATAMALMLPKNPSHLTNLTVPKETYQDVRRRFQPRFDRDIWPLMADNGKSSCVRCHQEQHRSSLRLTGESRPDFEILLKQRFLDPADPSGLLHPIQSDDPGVKMPPGKLTHWTDEQVDVLRQFTQDLQDAIENVH